MKRYLEKGTIPFLDKKRKALKIPQTHPALAIFDCFRGQTTPEFYTLLKEHNIQQTVLTS